MPPAMVIAPVAFRPRVAWSLSDDGQLRVSVGIARKARASNGSTVGGGDARKVRVEGRRHAAHQEPCLLVYLQNVALHGDHTVIQQSPEPDLVDHGSFRLSAMAVRYLTKIDGEVAHDPLDDVGAKSVVLGKRIALRRGQTTFRHASQIIACRDGVLNEALRQSPYRAGAKADEDVAAIVGVIPENFF
jgi:hypothetical protein